MEPPLVADQPVQRAVTAIGVCVAHEAGLLEGWRRPLAARIVEQGMSFQAYLDTIEKRTGLTPRQFIALAHERGLDDPSVKAGQIADRLEEDYDLGRGHAMALVHVIENGAAISDKHVGTTGSHRDESDTLWLDGIAGRPTA